MSYERLDTGNRWRRQQHSVANDAAAIKLKYLPVKKLLAHVTGANGVLRKSADSGVTWTNATMLSGMTVCLDVCEDPDGGIWGLFYDAGTATAKVGLSTDAMASWTLKHTHDAGKQAFNIACSPQRAAENTVAFTCRTDTGVDGDHLGDHFEVVISTDSGTTWAIKTPGYRLTDDQDEPLISFIPGKIFVMLRGRKIPAPAPSIWSAVTTMDSRFVPQWGLGHADPGVGDPMGAIDPQLDRMVVTLASSSGDPTLVVSGANATLLVAHDSGTPANFGGDGHAWWRTYYLEPTADHIDMTGSTGVLRFITFFRNSQPLVDVQQSFISDWEYHGAMVGTAIEEATASQATEYGDVIWNWIDHYERSIDDLTYEKKFHSAFFNQDYTRHNSAFVPFEPNGGADSSIDWHIDADNDGNSHSTTMTFKGTAVADPMIFPNSVRVLVMAQTLRLRGMRDTTEDFPAATFVITSDDNGANWKEPYKNEDAPLPVELIKYADSSPIFAVAADPNVILRWTGKWETFHDPLTVGGETADIASLAYDLLSDRLFVSYINSPRIFALLRASVVDVAQANSAVDAKADVLFDEGVEGYWQLIPRWDSNPPSTYRQLLSHKKARQA